MPLSVHRCPTACPPGVLFPLHTSVSMQVPDVPATSQLGGPSSGVTAPWQHCTFAGPGHSPGVLVPPHVGVRRHLPPGQVAVVQHWKSSGPGHLPAARGGNGVSVGAVRGPPLLHACHATATSSSAWERHASTEVPVPDSASAHNTHDECDPLRKPRQRGECHSCRPSATSIVLANRVFCI